MNSLLIINIFSSDDHIAWYPSNLNIKYHLPKIPFNMEVLKKKLFALEYDNDIIEIKT